MTCAHPHVVVHRNDTDVHDWPGERESECGCGPATLCATCDFTTLADACSIGAPPEVVDAYRLRTARRASVLN